MEAQVVIAGGGLAGLSLATALGKMNIETVVIEKNSLQELANEPDGRALAVTPAARYFLTRLKAWEHIDVYGKIDEIHVSDDHAPLFLHFDKIKNGSMGHIVESFRLRRALTETARAQKSVTILDEETIEDVNFEELSVKWQLASGKNLTSRLAVGAEGRRSSLRNKANIQLTKWDYEQTAFVFNIHQSKPHNNVAIELFRPSGPFALLPLEEAHKGSIVFCAFNKDAQTLKKMNNEEFEAHLMTISQGMIGDIKVITKRWAFPLSWQWAHRMIDNRLALIGDAAHGMHPIAGQGINMGFRDSAQLAEDIYKAIKQSKDAGHSSYLEQYQKARRYDNLQMMLATDGLVKLFCSRLPPLPFIRQLGLGAMQKMPWFKSKFVKEAMGVKTSLPKLMQPIDKNIKHQ